MTPDDLDKAKDQLGSLGPRQREVLGLVCEGLEYKDIAERLTISINTVKTHMRQVYLKLNLADIRSKTQKARKLHEVYCPLLEAAAIAPPLPGADEPQPVPEEVARAFEEDERALVLWQPRPVAHAASTAIQAREQALPPQVIVQPQKRPKPLRWMVFGMILGALLVAAVAWWVIQPLRRQVASLAQALLTPVVVTSERTVIVTASPAPTSTAVVVTATPLPPTDTPQPTHTPLVPTDTPVPTASITPAATVLFSDDFTNGRSELWRVLSGEPIIVQGQLGVAGDDVTLELGDETWSQYTVDLDYTTDYFYLIVAQVFRYDVDYGDWQAFQGNRWTRIADGPSPSFSGHLRLIVSENSFAIFIDGVAFFDVKDVSNRPGPFGINITDNRVFIDNVVVTTP